MNPTQQFRRRLVRSNPNDLIYYLPMGARVENAVNRAIWIGPRSYLGSVLVSFWVFGLCFLPNESPSSMRFSVAILAQAIYVKAVKSLCRTDRPCFVAFKNLDEDHATKADKQAAVARTLLATRQHETVESRYGSLA